MSQPSLSDRLRILRRPTVEIRRLAQLGTTPPTRGQQPMSRARRLISGGPQPNEGGGDGRTLLGG